VSLTYSGDNEKTVRIRQHSVAQIGPSTFTGISRYSIQQMPEQVVKITLVKPGQSVFFSPLYGLPVLFSEI
jgi:hypothetical protein